MLKLSDWMAIYYPIQRILNLFRCGDVHYSRSGHLDKHTSMAKLHMGQLLILLFSGISSRLWIFWQCLKVFTDNFLADDNFFSEVCVVFNILQWNIVQQMTHNACWYATDIFQHNCPEHELLPVGQAMSWSRNGIFHMSYATVASKRTHMWNSSEKRTHSATLWLYTSVPPTGKTHPYLLIPQEAPVIWLWPWDTFPGSICPLSVFIYVE